MKSHYRAAVGSVIFDFVCSFVRRANFWTTRNIFDDAKISKRKAWVAAIDFVQESSISELSSRFFELLKVQKFGMPFFGEFGRASKDLYESDYDSTKSWDDRLNSSKSGMWIFGDRSTGDLRLEHRRCPAWNTGDVMFGT